MDDTVEIFDTLEFPAPRPKQDGWQLWAMGGAIVLIATLVTALMVVGGHACCSAGSPQPFPVPPARTPLPRTTLVFPTAPITESSR